MKAKRLLPLRVVALRFGPRVGAEEVWAYNPGPDPGLKESEPRFETFTMGVWGLGLRGFWKGLGSSKEMIAAEGRRFMASCVS